MTEADAEQRIELARAGMAEKLAELQRRFDHAQAVISPRTYLDNPWLRFAASALVGYALGRIMAPRELPPPGWLPRAAARARRG